MISNFNSIRSVAMLSLLSVTLIGCQSTVTTGTSTYSPKPGLSAKSTFSERKAKWQERVASIRERQQELILKARERRLEAAEKRKEAAEKRKILAEKRRKESQERLALRMSSKKLKPAINQSKINRAFSRASDDKNSSLRTGWVKIDGKFVYRNAKKIQAEQAQRKAKRKTNPKGNYGKLIAKYAAQHGVPYRLARAVVQVESSFRANATGAAGEIGLMQVRLSTARGMGYKGSAKQLYNPATNLYWGMKYLGKAHRLAGGSTCGTILKYNAGHGAKRMNPISQRYCNRISRII